MTMTRHKTRQQLMEEHRKKQAPIIEEIKKLHNRYGPEFTAACNRYLVGLREKRKAELAIARAEAELNSLRQVLGQKI